jgi:Phage integrase family
MWLSEVGHQKPNGPSARGRALAAIRSFFKYAYRAGLLRDNPAADISLPKIRMGEIRALSQDECGQLLKVVETNRSPFRKLRDRTIIVTFLLTGVRLREIVQLDKADIDLRQSTIRLHRKGDDINILPLAESAKIGLKAYLKRRRKRSRARVLLISCRYRRISRGTVWYLVKKYFKKSRLRASGMGPHILRHTLATLLLSQGENLRGHSEPYEPQESCYDGSISAFAQPRTRKSREPSEAAGWQGDFSDDLVLWVGVSILLDHSYQARRCARVSSAAILSAIGSNRRANETKRSTAGSTRWPRCTRARFPGKFCYAPHQWAVSSAVACALE